MHLVGVVLVVSAMLIAIGSGIGKVPLWPGVLLLAIWELLQLAV